MALIICFELVVKRLMRQAGLLSTRMIRFSGENTIILIMEKGVSKSKDWDGPEVPSMVDRTFIGFFDLCYHQQAGNIVTSLALSKAVYGSRSTSMTQHVKEDTL